jgi:hypothetical protein
MKMLLRTPAAAAAKLPRLHGMAGVFFSRAWIDCRAPTYVTDSRVDGTPMNRLSGLNQPGQLPERGRRAIRTGTGIFLIAIGGILLFALRASSPHWINWHVVGVILILAGALGVLLPRLTGVPQDRLRRWVLPRLSQARTGPPHRQGPAGSGSPPALVQESGVFAEAPTLADRLLDFEDDQPL